MGGEEEAVLAEDGFLTSFAQPEAHENGDSAGIEWPEDDQAAQHVGFRRCHRRSDVRLAVNDGGHRQECDTAVAVAALDSYLVRAGFFVHMRNAE